MAKGGREAISAACGVTPQAQNTGTSPSEPDADLRTDLPLYRVGRDGELVDEPSDIADLWRDERPVPQENDYVRLAR